MAKNLKIRKQLYEDVLSNFDVYFNVDLDIWLESPITFRQFVSDQHHMNFPPLTERQIAPAEFLFGKDSKKIFDTENTTAILVFGKGAGKDTVTVLLMCYVVYVLLCLRSPQKFFGLPEGEPIDLLNVAINAEQASGVFFEKFRQRLVRWQWLRDKYPVKFSGAFLGQSRIEDALNTVTITKNAVVFPKNIRAISGHSGTNAQEGKNILFFVCDEISGFDESPATNRGKTIFNMMQSSAISRFGTRYKGFALSFPRYENDAILQLYEQGLGNLHWYVDRACTWEVKPAYLFKDYPAKYFEFEKQKIPLEYQEQFKVDPDDARTKFMCFTPNTNVLVKEDGYKPISAVSVGDTVLSHTEYKPVTHIMNREYSGDIVSIKACGMLPVTVTPEHPFFVIECKKCPAYNIWCTCACSLANTCKKAYFKEYKPVWKNAGDLTSDDFVALNPYKPNGIFHIPVTVYDQEAFYELLGWYMAEGYTSKNGEICFCVNEKEQSRIANLITKALHKNSWMKTAYAKDGTIKSHHVNMCSIKLCHWLDQQFLKGALNKRIPPLLDVAPKYLLAWFLHGYISGDGWVTKDSTGKPVIGFVSISEHIALGVQRLCHILNLRAIIGKYPPSKTGFGKIKHARYSGRITGNIDIIHFASVPKQKGHQKCFFMAQGYHWTKIMDLDIKNYTGRVYNLTVADTNTYTVNNIITHNCIPPEISSAFIERPEKIVECVDTSRAPLVVCEDYVDDLKIKKNILSYGVIKSEVPHIITIDLGLKSDSAALSIFHSEPSENGVTAVQDYIGAWTPNKEKNIEVSMNDIKKFIEDLSKRIQISGVYFDQWNSALLIEQLKELNIPSELYNLKFADYKHAKEMLYEKRVSLLPDTELQTEFRRLILLRSQRVDHPSDGCFVADTKIALLGGKYITLKELADKGKNFEFWVYASKPNGEKLAVKAYNAHKTKRVRSLGKVTFNTGESELCTPDHKFMLANGTFVAAKFLKRADQLMSFSNKITVAQYSEVSQTADVYDITVPVLENFALSSGVFVHNSKDRVDTVVGACKLLLSPNITKGNIDFQAGIYIQNNLQSLGGTFLGTK